MFGSYWWNPIYQFSWGWLKYSWTFMVFNAFITIEEKMWCLKFKQLRKGWRGVPGWLSVWVSAFGLGHDPGIELHIRLPTGSLILPLPMSLPLSVCLSWINKYDLKKNGVKIINTNIKHEKQEKQMICREVNSLGNRGIAKGIIDPWWTGRLENRDENRNFQTVKQKNYKCMKSEMEKDVWKCRWHYYRLSTNMEMIIILVNV